MHCKSENRILSNRCIWERYKLCLNSPAADRSYEKHLQNHLHESRKRSVFIHLSLCNILYLIALLKTSESLALQKSLAKFPLTSVGPILLLTLPYKENSDCLGSWPASAKTSIQTAYKLNWPCTITKAVILENLPNPQDKTSIINYPQTFTLE